MRERESKSDNETRPKKALNADDDDDNSSHHHYDFNNNNISTQQNKN